MKQLCGTKMAFGFLALVLCLAIPLVSQAQGGLPPCDCNYAGWGVYRWVCDGASCFQTCSVEDCFLIT